MISESPNRRVGPYTAYYNRPLPDADISLAETGPGTKAGEYLRRYWHPFALSSEVRDVPVPVRLLGEDLVLFRNKAGELGLLHAPCIHRGVSLGYGIIEQRGIRCCYHGWLFANDGTVLETPAEPPTSRIKTNFVQGAYPVRERDGLIFAYMGPPEQMPVLPQYDSLDHPAGTKLVPIKIQYPCNWIQIVENACDPIHNAYLHAIVSGQQFSPAFAILPALDFVPTPQGFLSMATRRVKDNVFIRASDIIMPNVAQFTGAALMADKESFGISALLTRWVTPVDDQNSWYIGYIHVNDWTDPEHQIDPDALGFDRMGLIGQTPHRPHRERQLEPGDYDALVAQGPIANRRNEHLGTTDRGVVTFRRMLSRGIAAVDAGEAPEQPKVTDDGAARTYTFELVMPLPASSSIGDLTSLAAFGKRAAGIVIDTDRLDPLEREHTARARIAETLVTEFVR